MLTSYNCGKYLTQSFWRDKDAGELDSTGLTAADISFLEITDGHAQIKIDAEKLREKTDGILYLH